MDSYLFIFTSKKLPRVNNSTFIKDYLCASTNVTDTTGDQRDSFYDANAYCIGYSDGSLFPDSKWRAAQWFSVLAVICGSFGILSLVAALNFRLSNFLVIPFAMFFLALIFQSRTFIFFGSNGCEEFPVIDFLSNTVITASQKGTCKRAPTTKMGIAAAVLWGICAVSLCVIIIIRRCGQPQLQQQQLALAVANAPAGGAP